MKWWRCTVLAAALLAWAAPMRGQPAPWAVRAEVGWLNLHRSPDPGPLLGGAVQRRLGDSRAVALELALGLSTADDALMAVSIGPEVRLLPRSRWSPLVAARVGVASEESELDWLLETRVGVAFQASDALGLTAAFGAGWHGDPNYSGPAPGPTGLILGLEWGLGR